MMWKVGLRIALLVLLRCIVIARFESMKMLLFYIWLVYLNFHIDKMFEPRGNLIWANIFLNWMSCDFKRALQ